jgi:serine/threonine protein kinase
MTDLLPEESRTTPAFASERSMIASQFAACATWGGEETQARLRGLLEQVDATMDSLQDRGPDAAEEALALQKLLHVALDGLRGKWSDQSAVQALFFIDGHLKQSPPSLRYIAENIGTWLETHIDDPAKFNYCLQISPPSGIIIEKVLNAGAQKQVFVACWPEVTPHKVAFKCFHDSEGVESGDAFSHPLRGHHPNIIETFTLTAAGDGDEAYLVERLLSTTLSYGWDFAGLGEIVNLIRDIAHALSFVHGYNRIHGDVKLENIGFEGLYILLDFGLCRSQPNDDCAWTPTGNVRGLAPEQLHGKANTTRSDIWALGSVAFAALTGRPPYFRPDEKQSGFGESERDRTLARLGKRADDPAWQRQEIERRLKGAVAEPLVLQELLLEMLDTNPDRRPTAQQIFERCNASLGHFLRPVQTTMRAAPKDELEALLYLKKSGRLSLASRCQLASLNDAAARIDAKAFNSIKNAELSGLTNDIRALLTT